jgi:hypothetical protein
VWRISSISRSSDAARSLHAASRLGFRQLRGARRSMPAFDVLAIAQPQVRIGAA